MRLGIAAAVLAVVMLLVQFVFYLGFGFAHCAGDSTPEPPVGSDLEARCNFIDHHGALLVLGPPFTVLLAGVVLARLRQPMIQLAATLVVVAAASALLISSLTAV